MKALYISSDTLIRIDIVDAFAEILQFKTCSVGNLSSVFGPRQANLVLIAYASSEGSGEPAHPRSLAKTSAARSYKQ